MGDHHARIDTPVGPVYITINVHLGSARELADPATKENAGDHPASASEDEAAQRILDEHDDDGDDQVELAEAEEAAERARRIKRMEPSAKDIVWYLHFALAHDAGLPAGAPPEQRKLQSQYDLPGLFAAIFDVDPATLLERMRRVTTQNGQRVVSGSSFRSRCHRELQTAQQLLKADGWAFSVPRARGANRLQLYEITPPQGSES